MNFHREPVTNVSQVNLKIQDLERSIAFYTEVIGLNVLEQTSTSAILSADGKTALVTIKQLDQVTPKQRRTTGLYHFALLLPKRADLANIVQHFRENGVQFGSSDHLVSEALYLSDPDGNGIEIYADRDPSEWHWREGEVAMSVDPLDFSGLLSAATHQWKGLPAKTVMGHVHLHVADLNKAEAFYTKGLGFEVVSRIGTQALFISDGKYHHHIGLNTWNGVGAPSSPQNSVGLDHFTIIMPTEEQKNAARTRLKEMGAQIIEEQGAVIATDPSGNRMSLAIGK
ncbi:VOC family protein [Bacillaceae bacterium SIJ1]|uniref:VOC family protein n=1 Tax=Litoribacterium kuwaitense TaxID=1398745 RepID=UPI0013EB788C|nr:VOC family protein [Litoribacterium kuwaitense]NGP46697.1 VOC family protein [Litoribacterium kuwaitense]